MTDDAEHLHESKLPPEEPTEGLRAEFDRLMAAQGIRVPASRHAGALAVYADLERQKQLLRRARSAASEPASIFCLQSLLRGKE